MSAQPAPQERESRAFVRFAGDVDLSTAGRFRAEADAVDLDGMTRVVLDLEDVGFLDLAGIRAIFGVRERCEECGVELTVIAPCGSEPRRVLALTGADEELHLN